MTFKTLYLSAMVASVVLSLPLSANAAGQQVHARFTFDGYATCQNPPISNFPIHGEGTGVLSTDRSASLDMTNTVEGRVQYQAKLGGRPMEAPAGSTSLNVVGRHTLRAVRDYPNNQVIITMTINGSACSMRIDQRLKPGRRDYTFFNGSGVSYCSRPTFTRMECSGY